jgi:hypothetical protein
MSDPTDRSRSNPSPEPEEGPFASRALAGDEMPLPGVSRAEAAVYIGDMAGSLRRVALNCDLKALARLLQEVEAEAKAALKTSGPPKRRGTR